MQTNVFRFTRRECTAVIYWWLLLHERLLIFLHASYGNRAREPPISRYNIPRGFSACIWGLSGDSRARNRVRAILCQRLRILDIVKSASSLLESARIAPEIQSHTGQRYKVFSLRVFRDVLIFNLERRAAIFLKAFERDCRKKKKLKLLPSCPVYRRRYAPQFVLPSG